ncbi:hypothetical protein ACD661_11650 [Legionella lytica]|uniref:Uncharacterized protein n=1 Tax=Legionella lytica TaxID=96232 RepID=A0ABW8D920_9GAMM
MKKIGVLCLIPLTSLNASNYDLEKAELLIGIRNKNADVFSCKNHAATCAITISEPGAPCLLTEGTISITNNSKINAYNIKAFSDNANYKTYVKQTNNCPTKLLPNNSCTISFNTNTASTFNVPKVIVKGDNTNTNYFDLNAIQCPVNTDTTISADTSFILTYRPNCSGPGQYVTVTITNTGNLNALNLDTSAPPPYAIYYNNYCPASLPPGTPCQIVYTNGGPPGSTNVAIFGTNTNTLSIPTVISSQCL